MKKIHFAALLVLTGLGFGAQSAHAALSYTADDLFLGFRQDGNSSDILIDIGQARQYRDDTTTGALTSIIGTGLGSLLSSTFGSGWATDSTVSWTVFGTPGASNVNTTGGSVPADAGKTLYIGFPNSTGTAASDLGTQGLAEGNILTLKSAWLNLTQASGLNDGAVESGANSAGTSTYGGQALNGFGDSAQYSGFEANFANGAASSFIDLFRYTPTNSTFLATDGPSDGLRGTFTVSSAGVVSYNAAVPEPTSIVLLSASGLVLLMRRRRFAAN